MKPVVLAKNNPEIIGAFPHPAPPSESNLAGNGWPELYRNTMSPMQMGLPQRIEGLLSCHLRQRGVSLAELSRLLESAQGGHGPSVMFLRVPCGSVLLQKVEHLLKRLHKGSKLCLTIRIRAMADFDEFSAGKHQVFHTDPPGRPVLLRQAVDQTSDAASGLSSIQPANPRGSRSVVVQVRLGASNYTSPENQTESKPAIEAEVVR